MKKRNLSIDIAKGIGIILVVLVHILADSNIKDTIILFHMPLFFFLSGMSTYYYLERNKNILAKDYISKRAKSILVPYFVFTLISFVYWALIERNIRNQMDISIFENFINIFIAKVDGTLYSSNIVMWFLPCLFVSSILFYFLIKLNRFKGSILCIICLLSGYVLSINNIILPFSIETSLIAVSFIYTGYMYLEIKQKINKFNHKYLINVIIVLISTVCIIICNIFDNDIAMLTHRYGNLILFNIGAYGGIFITLKFAELLATFDSPKNIFNKVLCYFGINSISIMVMHEPIKRAILKLFSVITKLDINVIRENLLLSFMCVIIILIIITPVINITTHYIPWIYGKNNKT